MKTMKKKEKNIILIALVSLILTFNLISAHTGNDEIDHCSGFCTFMSGNHGYVGMIMAWLVTILIIVLIILVLILLIIWLIKKIQKK